MPILNELIFQHPNDENIDIHLRVICQEDDPRVVQRLTTLWSFIPPYVAMSFANTILERIPNWSSGDLLFSIPAQTIQRESNWTYTITNTVVVFNSNDINILITIELGEM